MTNNLNRTTYLTPEILKHWIAELTDYSPQQIEAILTKLGNEDNMSDSL